MNLLAHAALSFNNKDILTGNMISDYIKGKKQYELPPLIHAGLVLHRAIDSFTDAHDSTREMKLMFAPAYRLYSGAFVDVVYDYFLANDSNEFIDEISLFGFTQSTYSMLQENEAWFGTTFSAMFPYMKLQNWLYNYRTDAGIQKSFTGLKNRSRYITEIKTADSIFLENKQRMQPLYAAFFPDVKKFAKDKLAEILGTRGLSLN